MTIITDEYFKDRHSKLKDYTIVLLKPTAKRKDDDARAVMMEHGRKNMALQADGIVSIVCPIFGDFDIAGLYIFNVTVDEAVRIMDDDPAVRAGIFQYEIYPCKGFPGDSLA